MQKKEKIQVLVTGLLLIVFLFALAMSLSKGKTKNFKSPVGSQLAVEGKPAGSVTYHNLMEEAKKLDLKRDPFSAAPIDSYQDPQLQGILWDEKNPSAVINGRVVSVGSKIDGNLVVEIKQDRVTLNNGFDIIELIMGE